MTQRVEFRTGDLKVTKAAILASSVLGAQRTLSRCSISTGGRVAGRLQKKQCFAGEHKAEQRGGAVYI